MAENTSTLGFYGKIPALGDFVSRHLARNFIDPWDKWQQQAITTSKAQLTSNWLDTYLTSPLWRFVLPPNACDENAWIGVLMPSVDKVGRYYPLVVTQQISDDCNPFRIACDSNEWFTQVENVMLSVLEKNDSLKQFEAALQAIEAFDSDAVRVQLDGRVYRDDGRPWHIPLQSASRLSHALPDLVNVMVNKHFSYTSVWWTAGSDRIDPCYLVCSGLPPIDAYTAMLSGLWDEYNWNSLNVMVLREKPVAQPADEIAEEKPQDKGSLSDLGL